MHHCQESSGRVHLAAAYVVGAAVVGVAGEPLGEVGMPFFFILRSILCYLGGLVWCCKLF